MTSEWWAEIEAGSCPNTWVGSWSTHTCKHSQFMSAMLTPDFHQVYSVLCLHPKLCKCTDDPSPSPTPHLLSRFWVLRGQRQGQHQCEADLWVPGRHHLWKDVWEPGRRRSRRHRGQTGAPADRAARSSSSGLCMLKLTTPPYPFPPSSSMSSFSWTPGPLVHTPSPLSLTFLLLDLDSCFWFPDLWLRATRTRVTSVWNALRCSWNSARGVCFWSLLIKELKGVGCLWSVWVLVWCQSKFNQTGVFGLLAAQVLKGLRPLLCCLPVLQCGFTRRIWRRPSSECHLNPSHVYSTLFHVSQMSALDMVTKKATEELMREGWSSWNLLHTDVLHFLYKSGYAQNQTGSVCHLLSHLVSKHGYFRQVFCFHYSSFYYSLSFFKKCFYISFLYSGVPFFLFIH